MSALSNINLYSRANRRPERSATATNPNQADQAAQKTGAVALNTIHRSASVSDALNNLGNNKSSQHRQKTQHSAKRAQDFGPLEAWVDSMSLGDEEDNQDPSPVTQKSLPKPDMFAKEFASEQGDENRVVYGFQHTIDPGEAPAEGVLQTGFSSSIRQIKSLRFTPKEEQKSPGFPASLRGTEEIFVMSPLEPRTGGEPAVAGSRFLKSKNVEGDRNLPPPLELTGIDSRARSFFANREAVVAIAPRGRASSALQNWNSNNN